MKNFDSSSYLFRQFEAVMKPYTWQQGVRDPFLLPDAMNGSSQNFIDTSIHHGIEGPKG